MFANFIQAKIRLMVYHPFDRTVSQVLPSGMKTRSLQSAIEVIEYSNLLTNESDTNKWAWTFRNQVQWHAMAYVLAELCRPSHNDLVDRAWRALDDAFRRLDGQLERCRKGALWHSMKKLLARAETLRRTQRSKSASFQSPRIDEPARPNQWIFDSSNDIWGQNVLGPNFYNTLTPPTPQPTHLPISAIHNSKLASPPAPASLAYSLSGATTPEIVELDSFGEVVGPWTMVDQEDLARYAPVLASSASVATGFEGLGSAFDGLSTEAWASMMCGYQAGCS